MHGYHRYTHSRYYVYRQMQCFWCRSVSDKFNENQYGREGGGVLSKMAEVFKWFMIW